MTAIDVTELDKSYGGRRVLEGVTFTASDGTVTAILGASGSGKTTLLKTIAGLERADRGTVALGARTVDGPGTFVRPEQRRVGYVPQDGALFPHLNVAANIAFGLERGPGRGDRVRELLELTGLSGLDRRLPHQLSGGERQRVALARALAPGSGIVLLDEPFSSLDAELRVSMRQEVVDVLRRAATTAVLVTHDQDEALSVADQVALLQDGRIVQHGDPVALYDRPATLEAARFVGSSNVLSARIDGGTAVCVLGSIALDGGNGLTDGTAVDVLVRPERIAIVEPAAGTPAGVVARREFYGYDVLLTVRLDDGHELLVRVSSPEAPQIGAWVGLEARGPARAWPATALHRL